MVINFCCLPLLERGGFFCALEKNSKKSSSKFVDTKKVVIFEVSKGNKNAIRHKTNKK